MLHNPFLQFLNSIYPLSKELQEAIRANSKVISVPKKTTLLQSGKTCDHLYFIVSGCARVFHFDSDGNEVNAIFQFENDILISVYSYFTQEPSNRCIETLEDSILISLHRKKLEQLYNEYMELNFVGRKLTEFYYVRNEEQTTSLRMLSAKERYNRLVSKNPQILQRISLGHIASFLGISQETLSRIRKLEKGQL